MPGVRELKQNLSAVLDRVAAGETVYVTDRGRRKAVIMPIRDTGRLQHGIEEGWIRAATAAPLRPVRRWRATGASGIKSVADALAEDRGE